MVLRLLLVVMFSFWCVTGCPDNAGSGTDQQDQDGNQDQDQDQDHNTDWHCDPDTEDCWFSDGGKVDSGPHNNDGGNPDGGPNNNDGGPNDTDGGPNPTDGGSPDGGPNPVDGGDGWFDITDRDPNICDSTEMTASGMPPNVMLVVDKSGSMADPISSATDRAKIEDSKDALRALVDLNEGKIRFGWMQFPLGDRCQPGIVAIGCGENTAIAIQAAILILIPNGGTPTGETLQRAAEHESLHDATRSNFVVLITDGMPTCPAGNGEQMTMEDGELALNSVQTLRSNDIETFVVGIGEDLTSSNPDLLNLMAEAGGRARPGATKYYPANTAAELDEVLEAIGQQVMDCGLTLNRPPDHPDWVWVYLDGTEATRDTTHSNGWDYDPAQNQVNFYGPMCESLRNGEVDLVHVDVGCLGPA
jgi:hypothetical protein